MCVCVCVCVCVCLCVLGRVCLSCEGMRFLFHSENDNLAVFHCQCQKSAFNIFIVYLMKLFSFFLFTSRHSMGTL